MGAILLTTINLFFNLLTLLIVARVLLSWFPQYRDHPIAQMIFSITAPVLEPFQRLLPNTGMLDFSPMIAIIVLAVVQQVLLTLIANAFGLY